MRWSWFWLPQLVFGFPRRGRVCSRSSRTNIGKIQPLLIPRVSRRKRQQAPLVRHLLRSIDQRWAAVGCVGLPRHRGRSHNDRRLKLFRRFVRTKDQCPQMWHTNLPFTLRCEACWPSWGTRSAATNDVNVLVSDEQGRHTALRPFFTKVGRSLRRGRV